MRQRDIGRFTGLDREGQADQLRLLGVDAGGLTVEGDQLCLLQFLQPGIELRLFQHKLVITGACRCGFSGLFGGCVSRFGEQIFSRRSSLGRQ